MNLRWALVVVISLVGLAAFAASVSATTAKDFTAVQQWKGVFGDIDVKTNAFGPHKVKIDTKGLSDVYVTRNAIAAGGHSGWHTHPGPSLIIVTAGEITAYTGDDPSCTGTRYRAGEGFVDPGDGQVHILRNESNAPAETVAFQIIPKDAVRRIDAPAPDGCPF
jgi:quercetin dioxygenase-like cupin family protein